jgi:hypothetical protein
LLTDFFLTRFSYDSTISGKALTNFVKTNPSLICCRIEKVVFSTTYEISCPGIQIASPYRGCKHLERRHTMKSLKNGTSVRFRIAAAIVFAVGLLLSSPVMALDSYDFGEVAVGSETTVGLDIQNLSPSSKLTFSLSFASGGDSGFGLQATEVTIPAGGIFPVQVTFSPPAVGPCSDTLQVFYGTFYLEQISFSLQGTGIEAVAPKTASLSPMAAAMQRWASAVASKEYRGQTIGDRVQQCFDSADNHGQAVSCVAKLAAQLRKDRRISRWDAREMKDYAVKSKDRFHKQYRMFKKAKAEYRETREKHGRRWSNWD